MTQTKVKTSTMPEFDMAQQLHDDADIVEYLRQVLAVMAMARNWRPPWGILPRPVA